MAGHGSETQQRARREWTQPAGIGQIAAMAALLRHQRTSSTLSPLRVALAAICRDRGRSIVETGSNSSGTVLLRSTQVKKLRRPPIFA